MLWRDSCQSQKRRRKSITLLQAAFPAAKEVFDSLTAHPEITEIKFGRHKVSRDFYDTLVVGPLMTD